MASKCDSGCIKELGKPPIEKTRKISAEKPAVAVLLSAYNGGKHIREQIDSVLNQTWQNTQLYVRDDGSVDGTMLILKEYERQGKLILLKGGNLGFIDSFFTLLANCRDADYYAWADMDDVWLPEKLERAVACLEEDAEMYRREKDVPVLYFSDYDFYDENMNFQKRGLDYRRGPSFANSLMDCISLGFNSVFNHAARKMMLQKRPHHSCGHDWWTYMVCAAFGRVVYDRGYVSVKYRRLATSVSPGGKGFIAQQIWRFRKFFLNDYFEKIRQQLWEFADFYMQSLKPEDKKVMALFTSRKYSFPLALKKTFYPISFRQGAADEIMVRILFLIGKL